MRSTSDTSSCTLESARLRSSVSFSSATSSSRRVCRPSLVFLMLGMSRPATITMSSECSIRAITTSLNWAGVSITT